MDVLCSDKTGTLTLGAVTLQSARGRPRRTESEDVLRWACINSALESGVRSPLDAAILAHEHPAIAAYAKRAELPFDFERRRVSVLVTARRACRSSDQGRTRERCSALCTPWTSAGRGRYPSTDARRQQRQRDVRAPEPRGLPRAGRRSQDRWPRPETPYGRRRARPGAVRVRRLPRPARPLGAPKTLAALRRAASRSRS